MHWRSIFAGLVLLRPGLAHTNNCPLTVASKSPLTFETRSWDGKQPVQNVVLLGNDNTTLTTVNIDNDGTIFSHDNTTGTISFKCISPSIAQVTVKTSKPFVGGRVTNSPDNHFYGVWEYPWDNAIDNRNITFEIKGVGNSAGVNWDNARAPFFFSSAGYGVYIDTPEMGSFAFTESGSGSAQFVFNTSTLTYYVIAPAEENDFKSIIRDYTGLSARGVMPPDSAYGPTLYSDDFEQDFHSYVTNAEQNYYDVVDHLYYNRIHAHALFADRPYGTGNNSWGNFDFDPKYYPDPERLVRNLTQWGFDFQVWVANRAFYNTELYNVSVQNGWLFPGVDPVHFLGPALNLSIPEAYDFFKQKLNYFPSIGVKGYKIDRGEEGEMPVYEQNIQDELFKKLCYETMVERWGENGFHDFSRSAFDKVRSYTTVWNGDAHADFQGLSYTVASAIRAGLIGFSHWTSDTGGYVRQAGEPTEELWARWMHHSAFTPEYVLLMGTGTTPWYPPYTSRILDIYKRTANLHHDLIPFIRSYTYQATQTGVPVIRALFLEHPDDPATYTIADEYFFGEQFLVAPIVQSGGTRTVYFPRGTSPMTTRYLEYYNKTDVHEGGSTADVSLELEYQPVFVKAGAIIPRGDVVQGNNKWTNDWTPRLTIEAYPSFDVPRSTFQYYNPDLKKAVPITMVTDRKKKSVEVTYGNVGFEGTVTVYTKRGALTSRLDRNGGRALFGDVETLF